MSATALKSESANPVSSFSRETLPGWTYNNAEFFALGTPRSPAEELADRLPCE